MTKLSNWQPFVFSAGNTLQSLIDGKPNENVKVIEYHEIININKLPINAVMP